MADLGFLEEAVVEIALGGSDGPSVIAALLERLTAAVPELAPQQALLQTALVDREELASTALGLGFAVPHCKIAGLDRIVGVYGRTPAGVPWGERDDTPVRGFFLIVSPLEASGMHIRVLAALSRLVRDEATRDVLLNAGSAAAVVEAIERLDTAGPA